MGAVERSMGLCPTKAEDAHPLPGKPEPGSSCLCHHTPITKQNYVEYQAEPSMKWYSSKYAEEAIRQMRDRQYADFNERWNKVKQGDKEACNAEFKRYVDSGPPQWLKDEHGLPLTGGDTHIVKLWFSSTNSQESAQLKGALKGKEREDEWGRMKEAYIAMNS